MIDRRTFQPASRFGDRKGMRFDERYGDRRVTVLEGYDPFLWYLSGATHEGGDGVSEEVLSRMRAGSPFGSDGGIITQKAMAAPAQDNSHRDGPADGRMVDFHLTEFIAGDEALAIEGASRTGPRGLNGSPEGYELFSVHCQFYEEDGDWTLEHWDPGVYYSTPEGRDKKKFLDDEGLTLTTQDSSQEATDLFIDNGSYAIEEGLEMVADTLERLASLYRDRALEVQETGDYDIDSMMVDLTDRYAALDDLDDMYASVMEEAAEAFLEDVSCEESYDVGAVEDSDGQLYEDFWTEKGGGEVLEAYRSSDGIGQADDPYELAWSAARWSAMADAIRSFADIYSFD